MINIEDVDLITPAQPRTLLINPKWKFTAYSADTNHSKSDQWTVDELSQLVMTQYARLSCLVILMISGTALAEGRHIPVCNAWRRYPQTVGTWKLSNPRRAGNGYLDDGAYYFLICRAKDKNIRVADAKPSPRCFESPSYGTGATYGPEFFEYIETIGNPPYMQVFPRQGYMNHIPDHWYYWNPEKPKINTNGMVKD